MNNQRMRLGLTLGAVACLAVPVAGMMGCFSNTDTTPNAASGSPSGTSGATGAGGGMNDSGGTSSGAMSGAMSGAVGGGGEAGPTAGPIDDMMNMQSETGGSWYTYSDRTIPNSEPPIVISPAPPGAILPKEGDPFYPTTPTGAADPKAPMINGVAYPYREVTGGGNTTWGSGFGMDLVSKVPEGGTVKFNSCPLLMNPDGGMLFDTTGTLSNVGIPQVYDAKAMNYTGFSFWGISFGATQEIVSVQLDDGDTNPWAGKCDPCKNGGACVGTDCACSGSFSYKEPFMPGVWTRYIIKWTDTKLAPASWTMQGLKAGGFDASTMYNIHFQLSTTSTKPLPAFDVGVADLEWLND